MSDERSAAQGALSGLRVLDLTGRMGGYCGLLLANLRCRSRSHRTARRRSDAP